MEVSSIVHTKGFSILDFRSRLNAAERRLCNDGKVSCDYRGCKAKNRNVMHERATKSEEETNVSDRRRKTQTDERETRIQELGKNPNFV